MDAREFAKLLRGYEELSPQELLDDDFEKGGYLRYAIETVSSRGRVVHTDYKRGGLLTTIEPTGRYVRLMNPYSSTTNGRPYVWAIKLIRPDNERIRLWYKPRCKAEEVVLFRELLKQLEEGKISIIQRR